MTPLSTYHHRHHHYLRHLAEASSKSPRHTDRGTLHSRRPGEHPASDPPTLSTQLPTLPHDFSTRQPPAGLLLRRDLRPRDPTLERDRRALRARRSFQ
mmetsp:Transcript_22272/g.69723  ORF Transcript_22272/g.69723 Transcript_22272/m.69723 type:complete len:98 (-) Transcript_22272:157-450(-)